MRALLLVLLSSACLLHVRAGDAVEIGTKNATCEYSKFLTLVSSPNGKTVRGDNCNAVCSKGDWQMQPTVSFNGAKPDKTYTLLCVDPDPPAYKDGQYWLHWLVSNIGGDDFIRGDLSKAKHLTSYYGPAPPSGSGLHRYMFLAYEEENGDVALDVPRARSKFELLPWLEKHPKLHGPVAGVQFRTQF